MKSGRVVEPILMTAKKGGGLLSLLVPFREVRVTIKIQQPLWKSFFTDLVPEVELQKCRINPDNHC